MRISSKAEYACLAVAELAIAGSAGAPKRTQDIAEAQGIPKRYLTQILLHLKAAGLVHSVRGSVGGYQLARMPDQITVADVITAVDGRNDAGGRGESMAAKNLAQLLTDARSAEQSVLKSTTIAQLAEIVAPHDWVL
jgi:Rrf2 family protein